MSEWSECIGKTRCCWLILCLACCLSLVGCPMDWDTMEEAMLLTIGERVTGSLPVGDVDYFKFEAEANIAYVIVCPETTLASLTVLDGDGTVLFNVMEQPQKVLMHGIVFEEADMYYIRLEADLRASIDGRASYPLNNETGLDTYSLVVEELPPIETLAESAEALSLGDTVEDYLVLGDVHCYTVTVPKTVGEEEAIPYLVTLELPRGGNGVIIEVYDEDFARVDWLRVGDPHRVISTNVDQAFYYLVDVRSADSTYETDLGLNEWARAGYALTYDKAPRLKVTPPTHTVDAAGGSVTFTVKNTGSGTLNWNASCNEYWLTFDGGSAAGTDSGHITCQIAENTSSYGRTAYIYVQSDEGGGATVTVSQEGQEYY